MLTLEQIAYNLKSSLAHQALFLGRQRFGLVLPRFWLTGRRFVSQRQALLADGAFTRYRDNYQQERQSRGLAWLWFRVSHWLSRRQAFMRYCELASQAETLNQFYNRRVIKLPRNDSTNQPIAVSTDILELDNLQHQDMAPANLLGPWLHPVYQTQGWLLVSDIIANSSLLSRVVGFFGQLFGNTPRTNTPVTNAIVPYVAPSPSPSNQAAPLSSSLATASSKPPMQRATTAEEVEILSLDIRDVLYQSFDSFNLDSSTPDGERERFMREFNRVYKQHLLLLHPDYYQGKTDNNDNDLQSFATACAQELAICFDVLQKAIAEAKKPNYGEITDRLGDAFWSRREVRKQNLIARLKRENAARAAAEAEAFERAMAEAYAARLEAIRQDQEQISADIEELKQDFAELRAQANAQADRHEAELAEINARVNERDVQLAEVRTTCHELSTDANLLIALASGQAIDSVDIEALRTKYCSANSNPLSTFSEKIDAMPPAPSSTKVKAPVCGLFSEARATLLTPASSPSEPSSPKETTTFNPSDDNAAEPADVITAYS